MPAEKGLLNSVAAADVMNNIGTEFFIEAGSALSVRWKVIPQRNAIQLYSDIYERLDRQLEPRLMQLLCQLAKANGRVVTRDELMDTLWPRVVVNENSLTRAVSELRKAFVLPEDCGAKAAVVCPRLIETVPKRGYRLNAALRPISDIEPSAVANIRSPVSVRRVSVLHGPAIRYPAIAAAMVISAALSSVWTLKLSNTPELDLNAQLAQSASRITVPSAGHPDPQTVPATAAAPQLLEDRVVGETPRLPEGLHWLESVHNVSGSADGSQPSDISLSVLAPGGQMMAFVENFPGQSQLRLRSLTEPDEAWTVFTSNYPIDHLQWSPLDAGLLFTVYEKEGVATMAAGLQSTAQLSRLMLLDLETLQIRELYRRVIPSGDDQIRTVGNLT